MATADLPDLRDIFLEDLAETVLSIRTEDSILGPDTAVFSNADKHRPISVDFASRMASRLPPAAAPPLKPQALGSAFEHAVLKFIQAALPVFAAFTAKNMQAGPGRVISRFSQFAHLAELQAVVSSNPELEATLGGDYLVKPDLVVFWDPQDDSQLLPVTAPSHTLSPVWAGSPGVSLPILHASISCKWTIRSDRVQNTRTEALNLVRNRKGRTPHIVAVTMEPDPSRLSAIALGTGDIDCVYHGALKELREAAAEAVEEDASRDAAAHRLEMMVRSSRLRDISDLPLDLLA